MCVATKVGEGRAVKWDAMALSYAARVVAQLGGIVQHTSGETDAVGDPGN